MTDPNRSVPVDKAIDLLALAANFARSRNIAINDPTLIDQFMAEARSRLKTALDDPTLIHGMRTERLFEAMVLSLGNFRLFKTEDIGRVHSDKPHRAPDFRIVFNEGDQWVVEVKNVYCKEPLKQRTSMSAAYLASLRSYAEAVGVPLRIAFYWSRWNFWTVISADRFTDASGRMEVTMTEALMQNELARLGDVSIATKPPLRLVLGANMEKPHLISSDGLAEFVIGSARVYSGDVELTDPRERRFAEILFLFGEWKISEPTAIMYEGDIVGVEYRAEPEEPSDQGFDGVGWASRIFSRYFATRTIDGDQVIQLHGEPVPDWFAPLNTWDFKNSRLPLWLFRMSAAEMPVAE